MFTHGAWRARTNEQLSDDIRRWWHIVAHCLAAVVDEPLQRACSKPLADGQLGSIAMHVRNHYANAVPGSRPAFDGSPGVLGFTNGVLDLDSATFRPAQFSDFVSLSTGYAHAAASAEECERVARVFAEIYPVAEERSIVQRFCGYVLSGSTSEKYFLALTDRRGGDNGKSLVLQLILKALGDYAISARKGEGCAVSEQ